MSELLIPPMPSGSTWTEDQWKAIMAKNKNILVAAAAGSGKTAVLVERIIQKLLSREEPLNVDELLVVTFTSASAAEMRHRIGEALEAALIREPDSKNLRKQLGLLNKASISTLHSFCMDVIRKYYYLIDLDPGFRIADETEAQLLRDEVIDELFEMEYGKKDNEAFFTLVDTFTNDRSDAALQDIIRVIYDFARSNPAPEQYLQSIVAMYDVELDTRLEEMQFIRALLDDIELQLEGARDVIEKALEITKLPGGPAPKAETFADDLRLIDTLIFAAKDSWSTLYEAMQTYSFSKAKTVRGGEFLKELTDKATKLRDQVKKKIQDLKDELFSRRPESFLKDMKEMKPVIETLVNLTIAFHERFEAVKKEKGLVDYSDLEHYCLDILIDGVTEDGELLPSEAALAYRRHFKEVFVDEYQDTNMVQETILKLVSKDEESNGNLFMVGDVKQAIYRFRLAEPHLFLEKYNRFTHDGSCFGLRIDLAKNFRSRKEVLNGTNFLFKQIMGVKVGEIEYDEAAELRNGAPYPTEKPYPIELLLIDQKTGETETAEEEADETAELDPVELEASQLEAKVMAGKIKKLLAAGAQVYNPKTKSERPLMYRDIVILLRSMTWAPQIMEEFKQQGIPIYANLSTGYFEATEVAIMLSLLRVIDNPAQDIPLASVLRSPIVGLNEEELAKIRIFHKTGSYWDAVSSYYSKRYTSKEEELDSKIIPFYQSLERWRSMARQGSLSELIWQLYRETKFYDFVGGLPGGKQRQANLRAFYDRARQYEETSFRGLFRFLRFIERMMERGSDLGAARALGEQEDVVRIMTIHSSKGLEFPVVFIAGLAREFNKKDLAKSYLLDKEFGFAAKYVNVEKRITYPSLPQLAFKRKKKLEMLAEEMRILYVALTRAKEKLYLIGTVKDAEKQIEQWQDAAASSNDWLLKDFERASARRYLDWIGPALIRHRDFNTDDGNQNLLVYEEIANHPSQWKMTKLTAEEIRQQETNVEAEEDDYLKSVQRLEKVPVQSPFAVEVADRFSWKYSFEDASTHRSKQSVSEIKRQREISDEYSGMDLIRPLKKAISSRPKFMQEKSLSPAEKGTALHLAMQHVDLTKPVTNETIKELLAKLVDRELLTNEQRQIIDPKLIAQFFESALGKRMIRAEKVQREVPFTLALKAMEIYPAWKGKDEPVFIQGVIDCIFEDDQGLVIVDYKSDGITDRFKGGFDQAKPVLEDRYRIQIQLYAKAIEQIWKRKVTDRYLFFFDGAHILKIT
ncbi:helicase-exonuclease AddAB subunit AddA [Bacillota bacterium Lsc_1132]